MENLTAEFLEGLVNPSNDKGGTSSIISSNQSAEEEFERIRGITDAPALLEDARIRLREARIRPKERNLREEDAVVKRLVIIDNAALPARGNMFIKENDSFLLVTNDDSVSLDNIAVPAVDRRVKLSRRVRILQTERTIAVRYITGSVFVFSDAYSIRAYSQNDADLVDYAN